MKKVFLVLALAASVQVAGAQVKNSAAAKTAVEAAQKAANDAKKATKTATWLKLGQALTDAYTAPAGNAWVGASEQELVYVMGSDKPISEEAVVIGGQQMVKKIYDTKNYYFANGVLQIVEVTKPVVDDALDQAVEAYKKAFETDVKGAKTKDILAAFKNIMSKYADEATTSYNLGNIEKASALFNKAFIASNAVPGLQIDTISAGNAALCAYQAGKYELAKELYTRNLKLGFNTEDGDVYAKLADIASNLGDKDGSEAYLVEGFNKFPESQSIIIGLINHYISNNDDPNKVFDLLDKAKQNDPGNASLYYVEGNVHKQLADTLAAKVTDILMENSKLSDELRATYEADYKGAVDQYTAAFDAYKKAQEINPAYEWGFIGEGFLQCAFHDLYNVSSYDIALKDAEYQARKQLANDSLVASVAPLEKAFEMSKDLQKPLAQQLKEIYYLLSAVSEDYTAKYEQMKNFLAE